MFNLYGCDNNELESRDAPKRSFIHADVDAGVLLSNSLYEFDMTKSTAHSIGTVPWMVGWHFGNEARARSAASHKLVSRKYQTKFN